MTAGARRRFALVVALGALAACAADSSDGVPPSTPPTTSAEPGVDNPYAGVAAAVEPVGQVSEGSIRTDDGRDRSYRLYVPASLPDGPVPLLVALHGGLGSASQFAENSGFDGLAEANGFIVVYPDGISARPDGTRLRTWNGGDCCGPAVERDVDDVGFVRRLLDTVAAEHAVDPARVFATGHSNGAILAYRLACELSDRIVAIGIQAGSLGIDRCNPSQPVSVLHIHGTADTNHPIDGGVGTGVSGVAFRAASAAVEAMAVANGCPAPPVTTTGDANPDLTATTWSDCGAGTVVRFLVVEGASHAWMGHAPASDAAAGLVGEPYPDLDASWTVWTFLAAHPRV